MTTDQPYPEALPRCQTVVPIAGVDWVCALPQHNGSHHFIRVVESTDCTATRTTSAGIVFKCCLKRHDDESHFFKDQVGTVPVRRKHHLSLYNGGLA